MVLYIWAMLRGCYLPPDIQARFEELEETGFSVVSGSDEHGTPITVTAETQGISPQEVVDMYHKINTKALLDLGCSWEPNIDPRGVDYGGSLFNRTSDPEHYQIVSGNFLNLMEAGLFERKSCSSITKSVKMEEDFSPDRYVENVQTGADGAEETNAMNVVLHTKHMN